MTALLMIAATVSMGAAAAPPVKAAAPKLLDRGSAAIQGQWQAIKDVAGRPEQLARIRKAKLTRLRCRDTVSITDFIDAGVPLRLRDTVRDRTAARPEMAALLAETLRRLRKDVPGAELTIGDIAQQGCGQIRWGVLVHYLPEASAAALSKRATRRFGRTGTFEMRHPDAFMDEYPRFHTRMGPVWVERLITGRSRSGELRVETRRFGPGAVLQMGSVQRLLQRTSKRLRDRKNVSWDTVRHTLDSGQIGTLRRAVWHHGATKRWAEAIFRPTRRRRPRVNARTLLRVREARTDPRKPTSMKVEERYFFHSDGEAGFTVRRHRLHYEAHHSSHLGGFDADLSYVTWKNLNHFNPSEAVLNPLGTWRQMQAIHKSAKSLKIPLKALFVDRMILTMLKSVPEAKRNDPVWRKLRRSPGHDSHVHIRIGSSARWAGRSSKWILSKLRKP